MLWLRLVLPPYNWLFSMIYVSNDFSLRKQLWDQLISMAESIDSLKSSSWLIGGDFNKVLRASEKLRVIV